MPGAHWASGSLALPAPHRLRLPGGSGPSVTPLQAGSSGWQREAGSKESPLGKGVRDALQCQHICANITNYFPHYKHPAGRQGSNQPKLFKIETEIAAQGSWGSQQNRALHQKSGPPPPAALALYLLPLPPRCNPPQLLPPWPHRQRWERSLPGGWGMGAKVGVKWAPCRGGKRAE